jgi:alpha-N-arabinofuranosidase
MGKLRVKNGHPEPFAVKWWAVGNEMYGSWQLGNMPVDEYVKKHNKVVKAMRAVDPDIKVIAVGAVGKWDEAMFSGCSDYMDLISEHFYCGERPGLMGHVSQIPENVKRISDAVRNYHNTIPELKGKKIKIAMDEWNYWYGPYIFGELGTRYFLKDALGIAAGLHEYYRNSDMIFMANYAQTVNVIGCIKTSKTASEFETTGLVLKLYRHRFGTIPVEVTGAPEPLYVSAAWTEDRGALTISIVNPTKNMVKLPVDMKNVSLSGSGIMWQIKDDDEMAYNEPGKEKRVRIEETEIEDINIDNNSFKLEVQPVSVSLYRLPVK